MSSRYPSRSPWAYLPSLYFQQGVPVMVVQSLSVILYKKLGVGNEQIGLWTSLITWPWILKLLWSPIVESRATRRSWVMAMQVLITLGLAAAALTLTGENFLWPSLAVFFVLAFLSATHDIALDGYYLVALAPEKQAFFVGVRSAAFRLAMIFCTGGLVMAAGHWEGQGLATGEVWRNALLLGALAYGACFLYGWHAMPRASLDQPVVVATEKNPRGALAASYRETISSFFRQRGILAILLFILLYRFGESMLGKMSGPFLLDPRAQGGLELSTTEVGMILGNVGILSLTAGGLLGGVAISRFGLRRCLWPMIFAMNAPNLFYLAAAHFQPSTGWVYPLIAIDQFGYGFGMAALSVFTMQVSQGSRHPTSHFAIATGLMALGAMAAGIASGYLQVRLGYFAFFGVICLFSLPAILLAPVIPLSSDAEHPDSEMAPARTLEEAPVPNP